jgi:hypothetical protein
MPVCVMVPMTVPTMAQAMPTGRAVLALSASASRQEFRCRAPAAASAR